MKKNGNKLSFLKKLSLLLKNCKNTEKFLSRYIKCN